MSDHSFHIRQLDKASLPALLHLFQLVFNKESVDSKVLKKYLLPPEPYRFAGFMAFDPNGTAIGFCGGALCKMQYGQQRCLGLQFCDTMTLPDWQGKGVFRSLSTALQNWAVDRQILIHFAFLNQNSHWAYQKALGWEIVGQMKRFPLDIITLPLQKLGEHLPVIASLQRGLERRIFATKSGEKNIPNSLQSTDSLTVIHDANFYAEKSNPPPYFLEIDGTTVWLKSQKNAWIGDIHLREDQNIKSFIRQLKALARAAGIHRIHLQLYDSTTHCQRMQTAMKAHPSWSIGGKSFDPHIPISQLRLCLGDIDTF